MFEDLKRAAAMLFISQDESTKTIARQLFHDIFMVEFTDFAKTNTYSSQDIEIIFDAYMNGVISSIYPSGIAELKS